MRNVADFPRVKDDKPDSIMKFATAVKNLVATMESREKLNYLVNPILTDQLIQKLSIGLKHRWRKRVKMKKISATLINFANFLSEESETASAYYEHLLDEKYRRDCHYRQ